MTNWIKGNVKNVNHYVDGIPWVVLFCSTMWYIWKCKNEDIFSGKKSEPTIIVHQCKRFARDIMESFQQKYTVNQHNMGQQIMINWSFPPAGVIKLNTDGSLAASSARASYGGVFRDDQGNWMLGYYGFIGNTSILNAEMWSIQQGLKIAKARNWSNLLIETDSETAVQLLKSEKEEDHPLGMMMKECRMILEFINGNIQHVWREGNMCADSLAKLGGMQNETIVLMDKPFGSVNLAYLADLTGTMYVQP